MARLKINRTTILHPAKKVGYHVRNKTNQFGAFFREKDPGVALLAIMAIIGFAFGIWDNFFDSVKPQISAVVSPATATITADADRNTSEILSRLNTQLATSKTADSTLIKQLPAPKTSAAATALAEPSSPLIEKPSPGPTRLTVPEPASNSEQMQLPSSPPIQEFTVDNEKILPIALRASEQAVPGHFLDQSAASALFNQLTAQNLNVFNEADEIVDESQIALFIDILSVHAKSAPSKNLKCHGDYAEWIATATVQISVTWKDGKNLFFPGSISGSGIGCGDDENVELDAETEAVQDASATISFQFQALAGSR